MPQIIMPPDSVASPIPPVGQKQAWSEVPLQQVEMPAHTPPMDLSDHEQSRPAAQTPPRQPVEQAPARESMTNAPAERRRLPLTVTCEPIPSECQACAECCACVGVSLLAISVGVWACKCSVATAEGIAIAGGSAVGASLLASLVKDCACVPCCTWR